MVKHIVLYTLKEGIEKESAIKTIASLLEPLVGKIPGLRHMEVKQAFKGMDYDFMKEYIEKHDNAEENMNGFNKLHEKNLTYGEIKAFGRHTETHCNNFCIT